MQLFHKKYPWEGKYKSMKTPSHFCFCCCNFIRLLQYKPLFNLIQLRCQLLNYHTYSKDARLMLRMQSATCMHSFVFDMCVTFSKKRQTSTKQKINKKTKIICLIRNSRAPKILWGHFNCFFLFGSKFGYKQSVITESHSDSYECVRMWVVMPQKSMTCWFLFQLATVNSQQHTARDICTCN